MIHNYSYKPEPRFFFARREAAGHRTYGVELEVARRTGVNVTMSPTALSERLDAISDGRVYCKSDVSVSTGVELVTHPMSLRFHQSEMSWKHFCQTAVKAGYRSHQASQFCGLHVHVGRKELGRTREERDEVARKLTVLVFRYWDEIVRFTRRTSAQINQWAPRPALGWYSNALSGDEVRNAIALMNVHPASHNARYTAVNLTNSATIEFRVFRGTLKRDTIVASIELVDNFCEYAMTHSWDEIQSSSWLDVALLNHYNELDAYLVTRGLATADDVASFSSRRAPDFGGVDGVTAA